MAGPERFSHPAAHGAGCCGAGGGRMRDAEPHVVGSRWTRGVPACLASRDADGPDLIVRRGLSRRATDPQLPLREIGVRRAERDDLAGGIGQEVGPADGARCARAGRRPRLRGIGRHVKGVRLAGGEPREPVAALLALLGLLLFPFRRAWAGREQCQSRGTDAQQAPALKRIVHLSLLPLIGNDPAMGYVQAYRSVTDPRPTLPPPDADLGNIETPNRSPYGARRTMERGQAEPPTR